MIVSYMQLNNQKLVKAFNEIKEQKLPIVAAYRIGKIGDKLDSAVDEFKQKYAELMKEAAEKDEDGKPVFKKDEEGKILGYKIKEELVQETNKKYLELLKTEIEIGVKPVEAEDLQKAMISAETLMALEPFITGLSD
jgi:hypothetical protein